MTFPFDLPFPLATPTRVILYARQTMQRSLKTRFFAVANEDSISNKRAAMLLAHPKEQKEKANQGSSTSCNAANFFHLIHLPPWPSFVTEDAK